MANIQMQYFNGSSYTVCYPQCNLANVTGTLPVTNGGTGVTSLSNISLTSLGGTLSVAKGGTGLTSSPSMLTNLGSTSADTILKASPRPGVTGTLPINRGGT